MNTEIEERIDEVTTLLCGLNEIYCCVFAVLEMLTENSPAIIKAGSPVLYKRNVQDLNFDDVKKLVITNFNYMYALKEGLPKGCDVAVLLLDEQKAEQYGFLRAGVVGRPTLH